ncbi:MAG TPA: prepilin peptidase [Longimicrobiaceae bacterium]|jgi:leader peptidase (prepilin peptidase)/N-methyltransferase
MPEYFVWAYAALLGAAVGSFLNVCIYRLPEGLSVVSPRSRCPVCEQEIQWRDNVPVLGWLLLRGRCRGCGTRISPQYPLVELTTALLWLAAAMRHGASWQALSTALFFTLLLGIAMTDARAYTIPDEFSLGGLAAGLLLSLAPGGITPLQSALGAALGYGLLWAVAVGGEWIFKKEAMGGGDIKMMAMVGAFLGPAGVPLTLFLGALLGTLVFLPISMKTDKLVPFGIFLALGAAVTEPWGDLMVDWYLRTFLGG